MITALLMALAVGCLLVLVQLAAALPWLVLLDPRTFKSLMRRPPFWLVTLAVVLAGGLGLAVLTVMRGDKDFLTAWGRVYGSILQVQLLVDFAVVVFVLLLLLWPKGAAVALASFREGIRQPMFWLIVVLALAVMFLLPLIPYFTFGEDFKMVKELGLSVIMLAAAIFGILAASMSISEEIEGRTAITLMSKPVSRRQFLIGKFVGILLAALVMTGILAWVFDWVLLFTSRGDLDPIQAPAWLEGMTERLRVTVGTAAYLLRGVGWWFTEVGVTLPGVALGFCQGMVLIAIAVALATRLPMIVNVVSCAVIFFLGHLMPLLARVSQTRIALVQFVAQLFDTILPGLEFFDFGPTIVRDVQPPTVEYALYVGSVALYAVLYTAVALLFGLILFEDRDLA